jgi:hypothetical protein
LFTTNRERRKTNFFPFLLSLFLSLTHIFLVYSAEVEQYFFPSYTHAQAQSFLEGRPPRSFLIRRSATEPSTLTFVISYVKSSGNVKHHRLYYADGLLTPQGSDESFASIADLLYKKGFLGGGEFKLMPGVSDRPSSAAASPVGAPRANNNAMLPPANAPLAAARLQPQPQRAPLQQQQPPQRAYPGAVAGPLRGAPGMQPMRGHVPVPADNYGRLNSGPLAPLSGTEYSNLGPPDAPSADPMPKPFEQNYAPLLGASSPSGAVPPANYGNVSANLHHPGNNSESNYSNMAADIAAAATPYTVMPSPSEIGTVRR